MTMSPPEAFDARLEGMSPLSPATKGFQFRVLREGGMPFRAGQHVQVLAPAADGFKRLSYSIASSPRDAERFELCVAAAPGGAGSGYLHGLQPGDVVKVSGPFGRFTLPARLERDAVFVAVGSGVAPLRSMILDLLGRGVTRGLMLLFGNRREEDILFRAHWEALARAHPNFRAVFTLSAPSDGWRGPRGYVQAALAGAVTGWEEKEFFLCGRAAMIEAVETLLKTGGVPPARIHGER